jgi:hypothetical protein
MRNWKVGMLSAFLMAVVAGTSMLIGVSASKAQPTPREARREAKSYWRHHNGHWSYWYAPDNRWYYTNGQNWFYNTGAGPGGWQVYRFDKTFGRDGFVQGGYVAPAPGATVVLPQHEVYVAPR